MTVPFRPAGLLTAPPSAPRDAAVVTEPRAAHHRRVWILAAVLAALLLVAASAGLHRAVSHGLDSIGMVIARHPVAGGALFIGLAAVSAMLAFFSSVVVVPIAVQQWGAVATGVMLLAAWLTGGVAAWTIGRYLGEPVVRRLVKPEHLQYYQEWIGHRTPFGLVLLFQAAAPSEITGYILGLARYPFAPYLAGRALAEAPYAAGAVLLGDQFLRGHYAPMVLLGLAGMMFIASSLRVLHRQIVARRATARVPE